MIKDIIRKELLVNIFSYRFLIGLVVVIVMMGIVGYVLVEDYVFRNQTHISNVQQHTDQLKNFKVYSTVKTVVDIPPSPLSVFCRGAKDVPTSIEITSYQIPSVVDNQGTTDFIGGGGESNRPYNPLLRIFTPIDLAFVIGIILSLFAILLVFDSFSGEREQGTLRLMLSTSIGRIQVLLGKFIGALITIAIPLTIGFLEILLIWNFFPDISLSSDILIGTILIYFFSLVFLAGFLALGLLISLFTRESSTGLMYLLLAWVLVAIVIPEGIGYLAEYNFPKESTKDLLSTIDKQYSEAVKKVPQPHNMMIWGSMDYEGGEEILGINPEAIEPRVEYHKATYSLKLQRAEDRNRVMENYADRLDDWKNTRDALLRTSLYVMYKNIVTAISGTDIETYETTIQRVKRYRESLVEYLRPKVASAQWFTRVLEHPEMLMTKENEKKWDELKAKEGAEALYKIFTWDRIPPLNVSDMPLPDIEFPGITERLSSIMIDIAILFSTIIAFLLLTCWRAAYYKVN